MVLLHLFWFVWACVVQNRPVIEIILMADQGPPPALTDCCPSGMIMVAG